MATGDLHQQESLLSADQFDDNEEELASSSMSLIDHLQELRQRIFISLLAILVASVVAFIFRTQIMALLQTPLPSHANAIAKDAGKLVVMNLTEGFTLSLLISFVGGTVLALPVVLYQLWAFIAPGLYDHEKKTAIPFIFTGLLLFLIGTSLGFLMLRYPIEWLITFSSQYFTDLLTASSYYGFVSTFLLVFGLIFEMPLVLTFLAIVGLVTADSLKKRRPSMHFGMWVASTFITPGADFFSPLVVGALMSGLYELTILFIVYYQKRRAAQEAQENA